ncbi:hypothetical protein C2S51_016479 [Perilla frutescens var. frutescens]|nr:hypothetical protein C2S51_016479 [Perilla frutescens var. frutescens]
MFELCTISAAGAPPRRPLLSPISAAFDDEPSTCMKIKKTEKGCPKSQNGARFRHISAFGVNILSRLPIRSIVRCKCVCKSWLDLLVTPEFVRSHISKSVPGLFVFERTPQIKPYKFVEFVDELDPNCDEHRWNVVNFNLPFHVPVYFSAANGLLVFWKPNFLIICNPITRDHITVPFPLETSSVLLGGYGFGVSRISGQYKVVAVFS